VQKRVDKTLALEGLDAASILKQTKRDKKINILNRKIKKRGILPIDLVPSNTGVFGKKIKSIDAGHFQPVSQTMKGQMNLFEAHKKRINKFLIKAKRKNNGK
jgi:hypothetical protein